MDRNIHFERMRETAAKVIPVIKRSYSEYLNNPIFSTPFKLFVEKRTRSNQCLLRSYLVRLGYELTGRNDWEKIIPACAAIEIFNISTYQSNIAFDNKYCLTLKASQNNQFICSMLSLNKAIEILLLCKSFCGNDTILRIIKRFYEVNNDIYVGQSYDLNELHISKLDLSLSSDEYFNDYYLVRCVKLGGSLTALCLETGAILGNDNFESIDVLKRIGLSLGIAGQMVNDIADFIILPDNQAAQNTYKDQFSDIVNGKITYPLFYAIKNGDELGKRKILDILNNSYRLDSETKEFIIKYLIKTSAINNTKMIILRYYKSLKKEIKKIPPSYARNLLSLSFSSLLTNKYFATIRKYIK